MLYFLQVSKYFRVHRIIMAGHTQHVEKKLNLNIDYEYEKVFKNLTLARFTHTFFFREYLYLKDSTYKRIFPDFHIK